MRLGGIEQLFADERRNRDWHPFILGARFSRAGVALIIKRDADVSGVGQNSMDIRHAKRLAPQAFTPFIQELSEIRDTNRPALVSLHVGFKDKEWEMLGLEINHELSAVLAFGLRNRNGLIAYWRRLAVPEAVRGIGQHRALHVLGVFRAVIFIEQRQHADGQIRSGVIAEGLGDGNDPHLVSPKLLFVLHEVKRITEQPR
ncbi:hypothetical protein AOA14_03830 [Sphingopyxis terrae subsp. terrae NBRC 15098]|uniref:Uncharacterized protein n=1 Tax=Sphingopyxis terrae subsp. terrae NBRC 15098 TaxID=1219058 RepID=A0A142VV91_9SPHN|nr:hypothetical protein AOA14_03830 [Sphingopyxis terrae subsp. terrae NBRC 15098]